MSLAAGDAARCATLARVSVLGLLVTPRLIRWVVGVLVVAWGIAAIALFVVRHGDDPIRADAVFVLSGSPTRLPVGIDLVRKGYAPLLVVSRTGPDAKPLERKACAGELDVPTLCFRASPYSTVGEAEELGRLAAQRHWTTVDVVTSEYHVVRARILMKRCYHGRLRVVGAPDQLLLLPWNAVLESVKLVYHEVVHRGC
jgi:uncharacterized SAM-binding protein YcdF (DUF218 family)